MAGIINGQITDADEVITGYGRNFVDIAQNIFNQTYLGFDSRLVGGIGPLYKNVWYSVLISDDAVSNTNFTYDSVNDRYNLNSATGELIIGNNSDIGEDILNVIPVANYIFGINNSSIIINPSFESAVGVEWTVNKNDSAVAANGRVSSQAFEGTYSYNFGNNLATFDSGNFAELFQTIDTSSIDSLSVQTKVQQYVGNFDITLELDGIIIATRNIVGSGNAWTQLIGSLPGSLKKPGTKLALKITSTQSAVAPDFYFDDFKALYNSDAVLTFSNDGATYEACTNGEVHRPTTTGQKVLLKISSPVGAVIGSYISEGAIKYNYY